MDGILSDDVRTCHRIKALTIKNKKRLEICELEMKDIQKNDLFFITESDGELVMDGNKFLFKATDDAEITNIGFSRVSVDSI